MFEACVLPRQPPPEAKCDTGESGSALGHSASGRAANNSRVKRCNNSFHPKERIPAFTHAGDDPRGRDVIYCTDKRKSMEFA